MLDVPANLTIDRKTFAGKKRDDAMLTVPPKNTEAARAEHTTPGGWKSLSWKAKSGGEEAWMYTSNARQASSENTKSKIVLFAKAMVLNESSLYSRLYKFRLKYQVQVR